MSVYDQHVHSRFSFDSESEPGDMVRAAIDRQLPGLTFTEHFDTHPDEWPNCRYDDARYSEAIEALREQFGGQIFIGKGIEICYQPQRMGFVLDFLERHTFDVVVISVHWAEGGPVHSRQYWERFGVGAGTAGYFRRVLEAARFNLDRRQRGEKPFDILGHLDLVKRYTHRFFATTPGPEHARLVEQVLQACLEGGLIPEVNTSSARTALAEPMPGAEVVRRYAALGGAMMSLGSDAHRPADVGWGLAEAAEMMLASGIRLTAVFRARQLEAVPLLH